MFKQILGITLLITGLIGIMIPFVPGSILIYIGLELVGVMLLKNQFSMLKVRTKEFLGKQ